MRNPFTPVALALVALTMLLIPLGAGRALAGNIDPNSAGLRFAWGENIGWINFAPA